ncbi:MAG: hypothetical protein ABWZ56_09480 [Flavobacterium sp.]
MSYLALVIVVWSFFMGKKSNTPYKSLLFSNLGFFIYRFSIDSYLGINSYLATDFAMYFILSSTLCATWFLLIKNSEDEKNEDRGFVRESQNMIYEDVELRFDQLQNKVSKSAGLGFFNYVFEGTMHITSDKRQNKFSRLFNVISGEEKGYYEHPQRVYINCCTYLILIAILGSFFFIKI